MRVCWAPRIFLIGSEETSPAFARMRMPSWVRLEHPLQGQKNVAPLWRWKLVQPFGEIDHIQRRAQAGQPEAAWEVGPLVRGSPVFNWSGYASG